MTAVLLAGGGDELGLLLRATLLIGAAWAAAAALRSAGASAAARHLAWLLGIAALLALPLLQWLGPALPLPILNPAAALPPTPAAALAGAPAPAPPPYWESGSLLLAFYLLGAVLVLLRFALLRHMLARLWRAAEPARDAGWNDLLSRVSQEMRLSRRVELRIARGPAMPMTWGTLSPKVLLPAEAEAWPPERRRLVLLHELAHVARCDSLGRSAASLACALYWFHPGAWFAAQRMRIEQEHAADDRVLAAGAPARTYALSLLHLARRIEASPRLEPAAAMAGLCQLERRLVSITTPARRDLPGPAFLGAGAAIAAAFTFVVAAAVPVRPPAPLTLPAAAADRADRAPMERRADPMPKRAQIALTDVRTPDAEGRPLARAAAPTPPAEGRSRAAEGPQEPAPVQGAAVVLPADPPAARPQAPAPGRQLAVYGPRLQEEVSSQDADARIPELVRQSRRADPAGRAGPAHRRGVGVRFVPSGTAANPAPGAVAPSPGVTLLFGQAWP